MSQQNKHHVKRCMGMGQSMFCCDNSSPQLDIASIKPDVDFQSRFKRGNGPKDAKLRVLCLHGHGSNSDISVLQSSSLKFREHGVAADFYEGAHFTSPRDESMRSFSENPFRTWIAGTHHLVPSQELTESSFAKSLAEIVAVIDKSGPYDGEPSSFSNYLFLVFPVLVQEVR